MQHFDIKVIPKAEHAREKYHITKHGNKTAYKCYRPP